MPVERRRSAGSSLSSRRCAGVLDRNAPPRRGIPGGKSTLLPASHPSPAGLPPVPNRWGPAAKPVHPMDINATCALRFTGPAPSAPPAAVAAPSSPAAAVPSLHRPTQTTAPIDAPTACPPSHPPAAKQPPAATASPPLTHLAPAARLPNSTAPASAPAPHLPHLAPPLSVATLTPCTNFLSQPGSVLLPAIALPWQASADWTVLHPSVRATASLAESTAALTHRLSAGHSTNATTAHPSLSSQFPAAAALLRQVAATPGVDWLAVAVAGELGLCSVFGRAAHQQHTNTQQRCGMGISWIDIAAAGRLSQRRSFHLPYLCRRPCPCRPRTGAAYRASVPQPD